MAPNLCDSNVWMALAVGDHPFNSKAVAWLEGMSPPERLIFCRTTQQGLLRLLTNAAPFSAFDRQPLTNTEAWEAYDALLADERISLHEREPPGTEARWRTLAARRTPSPKLWTDAYLAAFAIAGGYRMVTFDSGFRQFPGLDLLVLQL